MESYRICTAGLVAYGTGCVLYDSLPVGLVPVVGLLARGRCVHPALFHVESQTPFWQGALFGSFYYCFLVLWLKGGRGGGLARPFVASGASRRKRSERKLANASSRVPESTDYTN